MADPLYELLRPHLIAASKSTSTTSPTTETSKYLSRLVSLRLTDLTTTEPQFLTQSAQANLFSIQALSSRSHRTTTASSDHLSTLRTSLPLLSSSVDSIKSAIPNLDASAVTFASSYNRSKDEATSGNALLNQRRESALLARQADKAQDILELPSLLSAAIASAHNASTTSTSSSSSSTSGANYTQALDLFAHIKRLQMLYPDSQLVRSVLSDAELAMRDMTSNLIASLRSHNIRLAAAIRMIGWLKRVAPELATTTSPLPAPTTTGVSGQPSSLLPSTSATSSHQEEGHFGALFLVCRFCTFLNMTEALSPLRDLADQETLARKAHSATSSHTTDPQDSISASSRPPPTRRSSGTGTGYNPLLAGQQTERFLKRYIEIFREQSFATISMCRNIFSDDEHSTSTSTAQSLQLTLPPALQSFPLYLVEILVSTLKQYLPNVADPTARESLLMQVLYAANSLGRLGADFSLFIAELEVDDGEEEGSDHVDIEISAEGALSDVDGDAIRDGTSEGANAEHKSPAVEQDEKGAVEGTVDVTSPVPRPKPKPEPEWIAVIKKHRVQAARLEALAAGQERAVSVR